MRACRVLGLHADAERIEGLIVRKWMGRVTWEMTAEHVEMICNGFSGSLWDTAYGDAVVWCVLKGERDEEVERMLEFGEFGKYEELKERIEGEREMGLWEGEDRDAFLDRCKMQREMRGERDSKLQRAIFLRSAKSVEVERPRPLSVGKKRKPEAAGECGSERERRASSDYASTSVIVRSKWLPSAPKMAWVDGIQASDMRTPSFPS